MHTQSYKADSGTCSKPWPLHIISIPLSCLVQRSNGARGCALVEAHWRKWRVQLHFNFYTAHQGAVVLDNVKFAAKQLKAQAATIEPDREGSSRGGTHANASTHIQEVDADSCLRSYVHTCGYTTHPPTCAHTYIFTISMRAISSESAGLNC